MVTIDQTKTKKETVLQSKTESPKIVIVHNDDYNTFDHVISCLIRICKMERHKAESCTWIIHNFGQCRVAEGDDKKLKKIKLQLEAEGLSVTIENAP